MLVLSRQRDESIRIGDDIIITVVDIRGDKVRLGIGAPTEIAVHRGEVYEAIQRETDSGDVESHAKRHGKGAKFTLEERISFIIANIRRMKYRDQAALTAALEGALASAR
jgi:carbon storage regulator